MGFYGFAKAYLDYVKSQENLPGCKVLLMLLKIKKNEILGHNQSKPYFYRTFLRMGFNCLKAAKPLHAVSLPFTTKSPIRLGTHLIDLGRTESSVDLGIT